MSYKIDNVAIETYGFRAGWIGGSDSGYALTGIWSLPKREGDTYRNWSGVVEPYVNREDIVFAPREFEFSIIGRTDGMAELREKIDVFYRTIGDSFTLSHPTLGLYDVMLDRVDVNCYINDFGHLTLKLKETTPLNLDDLITLPATTPTRYGIDGYSWQELGLVVSGVDNRYDLPPFEPLSLTESYHRHGSRSPKTVTLKGTLIATDYADFKAKTQRLCSIIGRQGVRNISYFDGSNFDAFAPDGFEVRDIKKLGNAAHWATINCKMTVI